MISPIINFIHPERSQPGLISNIPHSDDVTDADAELTKKVAKMNNTNTIIAGNTSFLNLEFLDSVRL